MALSYTLLNAIKGSFPNLEIEYPAVRIAQGKLLLPQQIDMEKDGLTVKVTWSTKTDQYYSFADDEMIFMTYSPEKKIFVNHSSNIKRVEGQTEIIIDPEKENEVMHLYLYAIDRYEKMWSNSIYVGQIR